MTENDILICQDAVRRQMQRKVARLERLQRKDNQSPGECRVMEILERLIENDLQQIAELEDDYFSLVSGSYSEEQSFFLGLLRSSFL